MNRYILVKFSNENLNNFVLFELFLVDRVEYGMIIRFIQDKEMMVRQR